MTRPCLFASSNASLAAFSSSFPYEAEKPVSGPAIPIFTVFISSERASVAKQKLAAVTPTITNLKISIFSSSECSEW
jgi:hypothetical protein